MYSLSSNMLSPLPALRLDLTLQLYLQDSHLGIHHHRPPLHHLHNIHTRHLTVFAEAAQLNLKVRHAFVEESFKRTKLCLARPQIVPDIKLSGMHNASAREHIRKAMPDGDPDFR